MVNEAVRRNLVRHVDEYRVNAKASRIAERDHRELRAAHIELCNARMREFLAALEVNGMSPEQIRSALRALRRLSGSILPLAHINVRLGVDEWRVPVYDDE